MHSFDGTGGAKPTAALVQATNGDLYGTTFQGGVDGLPNPTGTAFKLSPSGGLMTLHNFCSQRNSAGDCLDGANPTQPLFQAANGDLYGMTYYAGDNTFCPNQCGVIFKMTLSGTLLTLYSFCPDGKGILCTDGEQPYGVGLIQAPDKHFYGTTTYGGSIKAIDWRIDYGCGTVFQITPSGTLTTLHTFCADGSLPMTGLTRAFNGDFYGTTTSGGTGCAGNGGCGTVFKITASGTLTTLYSFCTQTGCPDGKGPNTALIQADNGDIYGTTPSGGATGGGTIFQITKAGTLTTLYSFCALTGCADGKNSTGLIQGSDGNLYGTTSAGGAYGEGTVFEFTDGMLTTFYSFCATSGCPDGASPNALVQHTNGAFYGTARRGGKHHQGTHLASR
ncbi:MAG: choice-of-anchor tandem repeat GloVer-containing protein [Bryobacteraceae bacterium]